MNGLRPGDTRLAGILRKGLLHFTPKAGRIAVEAG